MKKVPNRNETNQRNKQTYNTKQQVIIEQLAFTVHVRDHLIETTELYIVLCSIFVDNILQR